MLYVLFLTFSVLYISCNTILFYIQALLQSFVILQIVSLSGNIFSFLPFFLSSFLPSFLPYLLTYLLFFIYQFYCQSLSLLIDALNLKFKGFLLMIMIKIRNSVLNCMNLTCWILFKLILNSHNSDFCKARWILFVRIFMEHDSL